MRLFLHRLMAVAKPAVQDQANGSDSPTRMAVPRQRSLATAIKNRIVGMQASKKSRHIFTLENFPL